MPPEKVIRPWPSKPAPEARWQRRRPFRIALAIAIVGILAFLFLSGLEHQLTLSVVKMRQHQLTVTYEREPLLVIALFCAVSITATSLSLPGAMLAITLTAGAIFGFWIGTAIAGLASASGSTIAFACSRYLLRDWAARKFRQHLGSADWSSHGELEVYLATLRLAPVIPYYLVNLAMGVTSIRLARFSLITFLASLPATMLYVNAGRQLGRINGMSDVLSVPLIGALALLATLPAAVAVLARLRASRARAA